MTEKSDKIRKLITEAKEHRYQISFHLGKIESKLMEIENLAVEIEIEEKSKP